MSWAYTLSNHTITVFVSHCVTQERGPDWHSGRRCSASSESHRLLPLRTGAALSQDQARPKASSTGLAVGGGRAGQGHL